MADQLEGRNPILECLQRKRRKVHRLWIDQGARPDQRIQQILKFAKDRGVPVDQVHRNRLDSMADGRVHNGIIARVEELQTWTTRSLLKHLYSEGRDPFLVLCAALSYEHNFGAVLRSALGMGVDGVILPTRRGASLSPVVQRVAMGAAEEIPIVREGAYSAIKQLKRDGIRVIGADMRGHSLVDFDLTGPVALLMGGEGKGLSQQLRNRCDAIVSIPLRGELESLNVSVAAAILMYEKRRQDGWFAG